MTALLVCVAVVVRVDRQFEHPIVRKSIIRSKRVLCHDEHSICSEGDVVEIIKTR